MKQICLFATLILAYGIAPIVSVANVDSSLYKRLNAHPVVDIFVTMRDGTHHSVSQVNNIAAESRSAKRNLLHETLLANAKLSQAPVMDLLANTKSRYRREVKNFWITNEVFITNADFDLIESLSRLDSVESIREEQWIQLDDPIEEGATVQHSSRRGNESIEWGIQKIGASDAWGYEGSSCGQGVLVGSIDTGVRVSHEALFENYVGEYGWFDPYSGSTAPRDLDGHGTHTVGTIVGKYGIGVAPKAKWMACMGCSQFGCSSKALIGCAEFMACPTNVYGNESDCSRAPDIVSNSWGGGQGSQWYYKVTEAWHAAGIIPVFAMGNSGPKCATANSPGDQDNVIGVGATSSNDALAYFSSVGPTVNGLMKPDISAPGQAILSAINTGDTAYKNMSGTSMACPHIAGVVALLIQGNPEITYEQVKESLFTTSDTKSLVRPGKNCGNVSEEVFPNNMFGHGRVNAHSALKFARKLRED